MRLVGRSTFETLIGSDFSGTLTGNDFTNAIQGGEGNDVNEIVSGSRRHLLGAMMLIGFNTMAHGADAPPAGAPHYGRAPHGFLAVQSFADAAVRDGKVPGMAIAIGRGDRPPTWILAGCSGFDAAARPVSPDSLWRIYSMTKPVTGIAAMILIDDGKLTLDQPLADVFPEFKRGRVLLDPDHGLATRPASGAITIRMLLTHTSGFDYAIFVETPAQQELKRQGMVPLLINRRIETETGPARPTTLAEFARRAARAGRVADPGTKWDYAMGLDVLGAVIEKVSGVPFQTFLQKRIFDPLGMTSTFWQVPHAEAHRLVSSYGPKVLVERVWPGLTLPATDRLNLIDAGADSIYLTAPSVPFSGSGLVSSARDYDRFLRMLLAGGRLGRVRILSRQSARLATSDLLPHGITLAGIGPIAPGEAVGFGAGGFVVLRDVDGLGRGKGSFGWDGAAGSRGWIDPVRDIRATMMINVFDSVSLGSEFDRASRET